MKRIINVLYNIRNKFISANKLAEIQGVKVGRRCILRTKRFGSEPYLIELGDDVATSSNVTFITHDGAVHVLRRKYTEYKNIDNFGKIKIGNNVFIGMNATILPNTIVGDNVMIGANSLVKGLLESNSVYAGVPAKKICSLEEYIEKNKNNFIDTYTMRAFEKRKILENNF